MAAGQPTGEQIQLLAEEGYRTVIDLRPPDEPRGFDEPDAAKQSGLAYVNIPVTPATLDQATIGRFLDALRKAETPVSSTAAARTAPAACSTRGWCWSARNRPRRPWARPEPRV